MDMVGMRYTYVPWHKRRVFRQDGQDGRSCYSKFTSSIINLHQTSSNQINLPLNYPKLCHSKKEQIFWLSIDLGVPSFIDPGQGRLHLAQRGGSASGAVSCALETRQHHGWELNERNHAGIL
jgi:hypothetical protein